MLNLTLHVLFLLGISQAHAASTCGNANEAIKEILNESSALKAPASADPAALAQAHKNLNMSPPRTPVPGQTPAREVSSLSMDIDAAIPKLKRAFGKQNEADALLVVDQQLQRVKTLLADENYAAQAKELIGIKNQLLRAKFLKNKEVPTLSYNELLAIQQELLSQRKALGYTSLRHGDDFNEEALFLKEIETALNKTPEYKAAKQQALAQAGEQYKAQQSADVVRARMQNSDRAAHPLTTQQQQAVANATTLLEQNPRGLTEEQAKAYRALKADLEQRQNWKSSDGEQAGMLPQDQDVTRKFLDHLRAAEKSQTPGNMHTAELARTQGRVIKPSTHDVNTADALGNTARRPLVNTQAARGAPGTEKQIQTALDKASPGSGKQISLRGEYLPIIDSEEVMKGLIEKLAKHNIDKDQLISINVISTLKPSDLDSVPGHYAGAEKFYRQMQELMKTRALGADQANFSNAEKAAIYRLVEFFGTLERDYIPPARRISP